MKKAVKAAQEREDTNVDIEKMELTLKGFVETSGSIGFNFKIPFVDVNIGPSAEIKSQTTQVINMTLIPEMEQTRTLEEDVEKNLLGAIEVIQNGIDAAMEGKPHFQLENASVEIDFYIDTKGEIALIAKGGIQKETCNIVKLYLKPRAQ